MSDEEQNLTTNESKIAYDPEDNSLFDEYLKLERVDFATSPDEFKTRRTEFVESRISHYEEQIDFAVEDFKKNNVNIPPPSPETKRNAARLLANTELGVKLVYNRYDPNDMVDHKDVVFSATSDEFKQDSPFCYLSKPVDKIGVQLQWLLEMSENPEKWYEDSKANGRVIGPINEDTIEDCVLFAGVEEASHAIYISNTRDLNRGTPQSGRFYYAENVEFQTLKVMSFFANKYFPEYRSRMKDKLSEMVQYRKTQGIK